MIVEDEQYFIAIGPITQEEIEEADAQPFEFEDVRHYENS